jgi:hypothetical protein
MVCLSHKFGIDHQLVFLYDDIADWGGGPPGEWFMQVTYVMAFVQVGDKAGVCIRFRCYWACFFLRRENAIALCN